MRDMNSPYYFFFVIDCVENHRIIKEMLAEPFIFIPPVKKPKLKLTIKKRWLTFNKSIKAFEQ